MLVDVSQRQMNVTVLGQPLALPMLVAPMAFQCLAHPDGELATARAATQIGTVMVFEHSLNETIGKRRHDQPSGNECSQTLVSALCASRSRVDSKPWWNGRMPPGLPRFA